MTRDIMLGDEAVARGAMDAGISGAYAYPGTPSTEIFEAIESLSHREKAGIHTRWSVNEKVALEEAIGMSYAGKRAIVSFKHVGLNVAADPFMSVAITGANGGLVIAVADDPSMHSSQNEQDSRYYADFAFMPCLEPADQQQAYDMTREAFELSERFHVPVMLRLVTRLSHARGIVATAERRPQNKLAPTTDYAVWTLLPANARRNYAALLEKQTELTAWSTAHPSNTLTIAGQGKPGIVVSGIGWGYLNEALGDKLGEYNVLRINAYPLPKASLAKLAESSRDITVVEEGYPLIEQAINSVAFKSPIPVLGRLTGKLPRTGELTPDNVKAAFGIPVATSLRVLGADDVLRARPPLLCDACPHRDSYDIINAALADHPGGRVMGDIGCYTLGYYKPYSAIHSCLAMGASISMASGASHAGVRPTMCVIGDSTFTHSGMTSLMDAIRENTDMNVFILDNSITAMTGGQPPMSTTEDLVNLLTGMGANKEHVRVINPVPKSRDENIKIVREEMAYPGLSIIVAARVCITYAKQIKEFRRAQQGVAAEENA